MLSTPRPYLRPHRERSLRREYDDYVVQAIEDFKEHLPRQELMALADRAVRELEMSTRDQLSLNEVLMSEQVDRLIRRQLKLPTFRRWQGLHRRMRQDQRKPSYWELEPDTPLTDLALRLEPTDHALIVGAGGLGAGLFLATYEWPVLFVDRGISSIETVESRASAEGLADRVQAMVVSLGNWFPAVEPTLTIIDPAALEPLDTTGLLGTLGTLKDQSPPGGVHYIMAPSSGTRCRLRPDVLRVEYRGWEEQLSGEQRPRARSFLVAKP